MVEAAASDPRFSALAGRAMAAAAAKPTGVTARLRAQAEDFESVFLSTMFQSMFTAIDGDGPMGSTTGVAPWRSFLTQEYAKSFTQKGGIGLADHVYRELLAKQDVRAK
jgi:Rod binding domain-containing protein